MKASTVHYVNPSNSTPASPFTTRETAATNIQMAVNVATDTSTVLVTNGTYMLSSQITVAKSITIRSVNGPDVTIVDGNNTAGCFHLGHYSNVLSGFTITRGFTTLPGGAVNCNGSQAPVIENCIIVGNVAANGGGIFYGSIKNCSIISNGIQPGDQQLYFRVDEP